MWGGCTGQILTVIQSQSTNHVQDILHASQYAAIAHLLSTQKGEAQYHRRFTLTMAFPFRHTTTHISLFFILISASEQFLSIPTPKQSNLMDYMYAAEVANNNAVEEQTHDDKTRTWEQ